MSSHIQAQFLNDVFHSGKVKTFAIFEILSDSVTKNDPHWLIGSMEDAGFQVRFWRVSADHSLRRYNSQGPAIILSGRPPLLTAQVHRDQLTAGTQDRKAPGQSPAAGTHPLSY